MQSNDTTPNTQEYKNIQGLFKHLLIFLLVIFVFRILNMLIFPSIAWSSVVMYVWVVIISVHLILFFLSIGIFNETYKDRSVDELYQILLSSIKSRNREFFNNFKKTPPISN